MLPHRYTLRLRVIAPLHSGSGTFGSTVAAHSLQLDQNHFWCSRFAARPAEESTGVPPAKYGREDQLQEAPSSGLFRPRSSLILANFPHVVKELVDNEAS